MDKNTDSFSPGFCEYLVDGYAGKGIKMLRFGLIALGLVLCFLLFRLMAFMPQVFAVWFVVIVALEVIAIRLTRNEFEYTVAMGEMRVDVIYGKRFRKSVFTVKISDADRIFPVDSFKDKQIERLAAKKVIYAAPKKNNMLYCLYVKNKEGSNDGTALVFSSCKKLNDALKFYNRSALTERK